MAERWFAVFMLAAWPAGAQWLHYPTKGVPRGTGRAGAPNVDAPAPKAADGHPDLSGLWAAETRPCPPGGCFDQMIQRAVPRHRFRYQGRSAVARAVGGGIAENNGRRTAARTIRRTHCLPGSPVQMHNQPVSAEDDSAAGSSGADERERSDSTVRFSLSIDRPLPDDPWPYWFGYSSGKWEGDTLVVRTIGFRDGLWLDRNGTPLTDAAKMTERFHRVNFGTSRNRNHH